MPAFHPRPSCGRAFGSVSAPFSTLGHSYVGKPLTVALDFATTASPFGTALACAAGGARMCSLSRADGFCSSRLDATSLPSDLPPFSARFERVAQAEAARSKTVDVPERPDEPSRR